MASMVVYMVSAWLYVLALCIATTLLVPVPRNASRAARAGYAACAICAAASIAGALGATLSGQRVLAAACVVVTAAAGGVGWRLWRARDDSEPDDGDDSDDDGGGGCVRKPLPPAPSTPLGGPPTDWAQFDRLRATWEQPRVARELTPVRTRSARAA